MKRKRTLRDLLDEQPIQRIATAMGLTRTAVHYWKTGESFPDSSNLLQLAKVLNTDVYTLAVLAQERRLNAS